MSSGIGWPSFLAHTPTLLIQPPRLVELATSGVTVTMRSATFGMLRPISVRISPKVC